MKSPLVSVIIPNYNHAQYLEQRIDSILEQSYQDFEVIVLDDASTDDSRVLIEKYRNHPKVSHIIYNERNSGFPFNQWMKGVSYAVGKWIWIAESDDWADKDFLQYMLSRADAHPDCGLVYSLPAEDVPNKHSKDNNRELYFAGTDFIRNRLYYGTCIRNVSGAIMNRDVFMSVEMDLFRNFRLCGDWFCYVLMSEKTNVLYCPERYSHFRIHTENSSSSSKRQGLSFIEGIQILRYIDTRDSRYNNRKLKRAVILGNYLAATRKLYKMPDSKYRQIVEMFRKDYWMILFFAQLFRLRRYED